MMMKKERNAKCLFIIAAIEMVMTEILLFMEDYDDHKAVPVTPQVFSLLTQTSCWTFWARNRPKIQTLTYLQGMSRLEKSSLVLTFQIT